MLSFPAAWPTWKHGWMIKPTLNGSTTSASSIQITSHPWRGWSNKEGHEDLQNAVERWPSTQAHDLHWLREACTGPNQVSTVTFSREYTNSNDSQTTSEGRKGSVSRLRLVRGHWRGWGSRSRGATEARRCRAAPGEDTRRESHTKHTKRKSSIF
jgi:hypothetical protein